MIWEGGGEIRRLRSSVNKMRSSVIRWLILYECIDS